MLNNLCVLVTRPSHQAHALSKAIENLGGRVILFPTLEIKSVEEPMLWIDRLSALKQEADFFIFVSSNAVSPVLSYLKGNKVPILAVGPATEATLIQSGLRVQNIPRSEFNSEGLLALSELSSDIINKKVVIFSGEQTNPLLSETLKQRGAQVFELEVYRRICPEMDTLPYLELWQKNVDIVISTSYESLKNWSTLLQESGRLVFEKKPLIVINSSMQEMALKLKLGDPILLARNATDKAILESLFEISTRLVKNR